MSSSTAELTLILKAQNLAKGAIGDVKTAVSGIASQAQIAGEKLTSAFAGKGALLARELGNVATNILNGQDWTSAGVNLGATLAGGMVAAFGEQIIARLASSQLVASLAAALAGLGTSLTVAGEGIGALIAAAIPIGMALLPALLIAAVVGAILFLIANPDIAASIAKVAGDIVSGLVGGLATLGGAILGVFVAGFKLLIDATTTFVTTVVGFYLSIPGRVIGLGLALVGVFGDAFRAVLGVAGAIVGRIVDVVNGIVGAVKEALRWLGILNDQGKTTFANPVLKGALPKIPGAAGGGWVGLNGPELRIVGEQGPEYVTPNNQLGRGGGAGVRIQGVSEEELLDMVDRGLYFRLQRSAPTDGR